MSKYLRNDSQTENLVEEDLQSDNSHPEPLVIDITDSRNIHVGVETIHNEDVTFQQKVFPKSCDSRVEFLDVKHLCVNRNLEKAATDDVIDKSRYTSCDSPKWIRIALPLIIVLALLSGILGAVFLIFRMPEVLTSYYPYTNIMKNSGAEYPEDTGLCFVQRNDWQAKSPVEIIRRQTLPLERVVISHTATVPCYYSDTCKKLVEATQLFHVDSKEFSDIGYNFIIGGDGCVYIGRGWNYVGAHTKRYNLKSVGIALIGTFTAFQPTELQINATKKLINLGVQLNKLSQDYILNGMCQLKPTESPGKFLYNIISTWDSFFISNETPPCKYTESRMNRTQVGMQLGTSNIAKTGSTIVLSPAVIKELANSTVLDNR